VIREATDKYFVGRVRNTCSSSPSSSSCWGGGDEALWGHGHGPCGLEGWREGEREGGREG